MTAVTWGEFTRMEPDLAAFGVERLTAAPAYLATLRESGAPRVHPVTPVFAESDLFVFMDPTSPKGQDIRTRGRFALHNGVPDNAGSGGEFYISGVGIEVHDPDTWSRAADSASYEPANRYILFELKVSEARCNGYGDVEMPANRRWSVTA